MSRLNKKVMLVGRSGAGKTTICQYLNNQELLYNKTQYVQVMGENMIDTPGEYTERRFRYGSLQVTSTDAQVILFVKDATEAGSMFAPGFAAMFGKPAVGIITKKDLADEEMLERAGLLLRNAGVTKAFSVSAVSGEGFEELIEYINQL